MYANGNMQEELSSYWKNLAGGGQEQQHSFQDKNPWVQPTKTDTEERITISTPKK
jgi:hypothetical protein